MAETGRVDNPAPPVKRSLFKKSAWAKPVETGEAIDLFSRAKEIFPEVVAENLRNRQKQLQLKTSETGDADSGAKEGKKRRISTEDNFQGSSKDYELAARSPKRCSISSSSHSSRIPSDEAGSPSLSSKHDRYSPENKASNEYGTGAPDTISVYSLGDSDSSGGSPKIEKVLVKPILIEESVSPPPEDEDKEFAEWIARARKGYKKTQSQPLNMPMPSNELTPKPKTSAALGSCLPPSGPDPVVSILISSRIEDTKPFVFKRKWTQRFKDIRVGWCDRQIVNGNPISDSMKAEIFLTWRMKRVFDVTTCKALGVKVDAAGALRTDGDDFDAEGRICLEAWTEGLFELQKKQKADEHKRLLRDPLAEEEPKEPPAPKLRIILKSKDDVLKLQVKLTTPISKLIASFRTSKNIPNDKSITLYLDGDEVDPGSLVSDTDLEDMVTIDVHIN